MSALDFKILGQLLGEPSRRVCNAWLGGRDNYTLSTPRTPTISTASPALPRHPRRRQSSRALPPGRWPRPCVSTTGAPPSMRAPHPAPTPTPPASSRHRTPRPRRRSVALVACRGRLRPRRAADDVRGGPQAPL